MTTYDRADESTGEQRMKALVWHGDRDDELRRPAGARARGGRGRARGRARGDLRLRPARLPGPSRAARSAARSRARGRRPRRRDAVHGLSAGGLRRLRPLPGRRGQSLRVLEAARAAPARGLRRAGRRAAAVARGAAAPGSTRSEQCWPSRSPAASARSRRIRSTRSRRWPSSAAARSGCSPSISAPAPVRTWRPSIRCRSASR